MQIQATPGTVDVSMPVIQDTSVIAASPPEAVTSTSAAPTPDAAVANGALIGPIVGGVTGGVVVTVLENEGARKVRNPSWFRDLKGRGPEEIRKFRLEGKLRRLAQIIAIDDPVERNRRITAQYAQISHECRDVIGTNGGANWCTWAMWASSRAGETIRGEDLGYIGAGLLTAARYLVPFIGPRIHAMYGNSRAAVAEGNKKVFEEIAPFFTRFIEMFRGTTHPDEEQWREFDRHFNRNPDKGMIQQRLSQAFRAYWQAKYEPDPNHKQELVLRGNILIAWHEQDHLDPQINQAMPSRMRRWATSWMRGVTTPDGKMSLGHDVKPLEGVPKAYPSHLYNVEDVETRELFDSFTQGCTDDMKGSAAVDWSRLPDRMRFISHLFRSRHLDQRLFSQTPK